MAIQYDLWKKLSGRLLALLLLALLPDLPLMKNMLQPLDENVLIPLGLKAVVTGADESIHKKKSWIGRILWSWSCCLGGNNTNNIKWGNWSYYENN